MEYLLDILTPAYNHEKFIGDTLEGVIRQKTDFNFRILIGEDCSTDNTQAIIEGYRSKYPNIIFPTYREKNLGAYENSRLLFGQRASKYIALCEGDDYWTDADKLQKQVDILEQNSALVGCFHNTEERFEDDDKLASTLYCNYPEARRVSFRDLSFANVIPTCSVVYRNNLFGSFPDWFHGLKMGDWPLHLLNAQFGDFWYIPHVMGVHRLHAKGIWVLQDQQRNYKYILEAYDVLIKAFGNKEEFSRCLQTGREAFLASTKPPNPNPSYKEKMKHFAIKMIEKF